MANSPELSQEEAEALENEFSYTRWDESCKDPHVHNVELRECRRAKGHFGYHASGFRSSAGLVVW